MSRTPARITQADVARVIRAAKQAGAGSVEVSPDGTIRVRLAPDAGDNQQIPVDDGREIVL